MLTNCPDDPTLLAFAMGTPGQQPGDARIAAHVERCTSCLGTVARHRQLASGVRRATREATHIGGECLDELAIAALADGVASDEDRTAATAHLVTCSSCRSRLAELHSALGDSAISAALPRNIAKRRLRSTLVGGASAAGLAAAAVLAFALGTNQRKIDDTAQPMRDETGALVVTPVAVSPVDVVSGTPVFRWSSVPGASRYRVRVFTPDGVVVWEAQTSDTTAVPSPSTLQRATAYLWKVEARTDFDRWVGSALTEFRLSGGGVKP